MTHFPLLRTSKAGPKQTQSPEENQAQQLWERVCVCVGGGLPFCLSAIFPFFLRKFSAHLGAGRGTGSGSRQAGGLGPVREVTPKPLGVTLRQMGNMGNSRESGTGLIHRLSHPNRLGKKKKKGTGNGGDEIQCQMKGE